MKMYNDRDFANIMIKNYSQDVPDFWALCLATAKTIKWTVDPKNVLDLGCGCGGYMLAMNLAGMDCVGVDGNKYQHEFFTQKNPDYANRYKLCRLEDYKDDFDYELITSIEVLEHMTDEQIHKLLDNVTAKKIIFSSTPHFANTKFESNWGHINVKQHDAWVNLFLQHGYRFIMPLTVPTEWTKLFERIV